MLDLNYGANTAVGWVRAKFGFEVDPIQIRDADFEDAIKQIEVEPLFT